MNKLEAEYKQRFARVFERIALALEEYLKHLFCNAPRIDRITARAKSPMRFIQKAQQQDADGKLKYKSPLTEIQDIIGARIIVFYTSDVEPIVERVLKYFRHIEEREIVPDSYWEFGYFGRHLILNLPSDVIADEYRKLEVPDFFELQVKTLFQHAWSEANHDLGYKAPILLTGDQIRRLAYTAAQAWGADQAFEDLRAEVVVG